MTRIGIATGAAVLIAAHFGLADAAQEQRSKEAPAKQQPAKQASAKPAPAAELKPSAASEKGGEAGAAVAGDAAVITIHGVCATEDGAKQGGADTSSCKTVMTKDQFERLLNAVTPPNQPSAAPEMRRNLARGYVDLVAYAQAAEKAGVEDTPAFREILRVVRMRTLADVYRRDLEEKLKHVASQEIEDYYQQNAAKYEEAKLRRVFVPKNNAAAADKEEYEKKAEQAAKDARERLAKGEDPEAVEKQVHTLLSLPGAAVSTNIGARRKEMLPPGEAQEIFALESGGVSRVLQEPIGWVVYKLESRQTAPLEKVREEISRELFRRKMETALKEPTVAVHADFNERYFGPPSAPPALAPGTAQQPKP